MYSKPVKTFFKYNLAFSNDSDDDPGSQVNKEEDVRNVYQRSRRTKDKQTEMNNALLLLLLSCFSRARLCATPQTAAHQAPLSLGFSRQEFWSGLPFPPPMHESEK